MAEEIDLSPAEEAALDRAWAKVGPLLAPGRADAPFGVTGPDLSGLDSELLGLSRAELLDLLTEAAERSWDEGYAPFYSPDQPRVPAGSSGGGRWTTGVGAGTQAARDAASDAIRAFARAAGPPTAREAHALAGHLAKLTVAQIHALKAEHGLRGSAPDKAALVAKLAERFAAWRAGRAPREAVPDWPEGYDVFGKRDVFGDEPADPGTLEPVAPPPAAPEPAGLHEVRPGGRPFKPGGVHVEVAAGGGDAARRVFGRDVDPSLFPGMANAAPGWNVLVTPDRFTGGVAVSSFGPGGNASRSFYRRADGKLVAHNESFRIHDNLPGTLDPNPLKGQGLRLFTAQVNALREAGVDLIRTHAAGEPGGSQNGYYTWPRLGFSGTVEDDAFGRLPQNLRDRLGDSREVRDLFDLPGGAEAWKEVGSSIYNAKFDPTPGSRSTRALEDYTREREARGK